jgi:GT2 family glycosyltransferase
VADRSRPSVSVSISCYNAGSVLLETVGAVLKQTRPPLEVVVVDDGSTDGSCDGPFEDPVRVVRHAENRGLGAARNIALKECRGDLVAWFDADAIPKPDALERLAATLEDEQVVGAGGREEHGTVGRLYDRWRSIHAPQSHGLTPRDDWMLMGLCCCYRRKPLVEAGGFDERFRRWGEDVEVGLRLGRMGYRLRYEPSAVVVHRQRDTLRSLLVRMEGYLYWTMLAHRLHGSCPVIRYTAIVARQSVAFPARDVLIHRSVGLARISLLVTHRRLRALWRALHHAEPLGEGLARCARGRGES